MPGFDRTGPRGQGPRTGGGRGYCGPDPNPGAPLRGVGRGGVPWGGGRGRCWGGGRWQNGRGGRRFADDRGRGSGWGGVPPVPPDAGPDERS